MRKRLLLIPAVLGATLATPAVSQTPDPIAQLLADTAVEAPDESEAELGDEAPSDPAICRTMTDMARRSRRERVCMTREQWTVLVAAAHTAKSARRSGPAVIKPTASLGGPDDRR